MRSKPTGLLLAAAVAFAFAGAAAQQAAAPAQEGPKVGPYAVPKHWSKYKYPETVPEGMAYHVIVKGDTLWDIAGRYLKNPLLWPQIWNDNKYITDAHWIYPDDPIFLKQVDVVAEKAGETPGVPTAEEEAAAAAGPTTPGGPEEPPLYPASEVVTMQCAAQILPERDDESLKLVGSEQGHLQVSYSDRDLVYLNKGSNAGIKPGDVFSIHRRGPRVKHPKTGDTLGTKVLTKGWARVILAQETSATAVIEQACYEILQGEYLKPLERVSVPLVLRRPLPDPLTPASGKAQGYVVDIAEDNIVAGAGHLLYIDLGAGSGLAPGNLLTVFRLEYPKLPSSRHYVGELAVLSVKERVALAKVVYSSTIIELGDQVEVR